MVDVRAAQSARPSFPLEYHDLAPNDLVGTAIREGVDLFVAQHPELIGKSIDWRGMSIDVMHRERDHEGGALAE